MLAKTAKERSFDLTQIATHRDSCLMIRTGTIESTVLDDAETLRFDVLPVIDEFARLCGVVPVTYARQLCTVGRPLELLDPHLELPEIGSQIPVLALLQEFERVRAVIIRKGQNEHDAEVDWFAMVTISDLNRHPFRSQLYPILAELESALAELIDRWFDDPWRWLPHAGEDAQVRLVGRWELEKREGVDTTPVTGCTLIEMINVIGKYDDLGKELGFTSQSQFKKETGSIRDVRNKIMHPVRPLVLKQDDVFRCRNALTKAVNLSERATALNKNLSRQAGSRLRYLP